MEGEPPTIFWESSPKARKQHKCCECRGYIDIGEHYRLFDCVWGGKFCSHKTCSDCYQLRIDLDAVEYVGKSLNLAKRITRNHPAVTSVYERNLCCIRFFKRFKPSEITAKELEAIRFFKPTLNIIGKQEALK